MPRQPESFYETITAAVREFAETGFDSQERLDFWVRRIREAALRDLVPEAVLEMQLKRALGLAYDRYVNRGAVWQHHQDIQPFTKARVQPKLRPELDRRIMMSANLIKLNRERAVTQSLQRFSGWASSIPAGGSDTIAKNPVKSQIRKSIAQLPFEERRVIIDQTHKLISSVSNIIASNGGAIAVFWHDHGEHDSSYDARARHLAWAKSGQPFAIKGNWALEQGLMKPGVNGYYEDVEAFGELVFCRCFGEYIYGLRRLPDTMITDKGRAFMASTNAK
jgi:hypothetical protein